MTALPSRRGAWDPDPDFENLIANEPFELQEHARFHFYPNYRLPGVVDIRAIPSTEYRRILSVVRGALEERDIQFQERITTVSKQLYPPFDEEMFVALVSERGITESAVVDSAKRILIRQCSESSDSASLPARPDIDPLNTSHQDGVESLLNAYYMSARDAAQTSRSSKLPNPIQVMRERLADFKPNVAFEEYIQAESTDVQDMARIGFYGVDSKTTFDKDGEMVRSPFRSKISNEDSKRARQLVQTWLAGGNTR